MINFLLSTTLFEKQQKKGKQKKKQTKKKPHKHFSEKF